MSFEQIDLSKIKAPDSVEKLDVEVIVQELISALVAIDSSFTALVESDTTFKILEVCAYREFILRQLCNDKVRSVMLAFASGSDLEHISALFGVVRKTITPGNPSAIPPIEAVLETDDSMRARTQQSLEGFSSAGPIGAYKFHALQVATIKDVAVAGPPTVSPGQVRVVILSTSGNGSASTNEVNQVFAQVNAEDVRPLTDQVTVQSASIVNYAINGTLYISPGADSGVVLASATSAIQKHVAEKHKIGQDIYISSIFGALSVAGVNRVTLASPSSDVTISDVQAGYCTGITLTTVVE